MDQKVASLKLARTILFVPAWYPSSFFQEQIELIADQFHTKILWGEQITIGKKQLLRSFLKKRNYHTIFEIERTSEMFKLKYQWINYLPDRIQKFQFYYLKNHIGENIKELFGGVLPDLIHLQSISDIAVFIVAWAKENKIPVILTEHLLFVRHEINPFSRLKENLYNTVDQVLCVSNYVYRSLLTGGFLPKNAKVIGNLVNDDFTEVFFNHNAGSNILFVANHLNDKGFNILIEVAKLLKSNNRKVIIDVIGLSGDELYTDKFNIQTKLKESEVDDLIILKGFLPHNELLKVYPSYKMLISTSISETFGLSIAEAIACGLPVVITDSGGPRDFVSDNNIIVPINDPTALTKGIEKFLESTNEEEIENDAKKIRSLYGRQAFKSLMIEIYSQMIK